MLGNVTHCNNFGLPKFCCGVGNFSHCGCATRRVLVTHSQLGRERQVLPANATAASKALQANHDIVGDDWLHARDDARHRIRSPLMKNARNLRCGHSRHLSRQSGWARKPTPLTWRSVEHQLIAYREWSDDRSRRPAASSHSGTHDPLHRSTGGSSCRQPPRHPATYRRAGSATAPHRR